MTENKDLLIEKEADEAYVKAAEQFQYPKGIVDKEAYNSYLMLSEQWKNHSQRFYQTKLKKIKLDLAQSPDKIQSMIESLNLPKSEIDLITKINNEIYFLVQKAILFKKNAFGNYLANLTEKGFVPDELSGSTPIIIELAGRFYKAEEIHQTLCTELEITSVTVSQIKTVVKNNITKIKELQEKFKKDYSDVRLSYKRSRLEELQDLYNRRKAIYSTSNNRDDEKQLISIIESIKKEIQGDLVINGTLNVTIQEQANAFIKDQMLKSLNIPMFIIARIAGKMNINPQFILSRLAHSRYAQFTGFSENGLSPTALTDEISYTSNLTYDWNKIEENNTIIVEQEAKEIELPQISNKDTSSIREKLLEKLNLAKQPLEKGKNDIIGEINS